MIVHDVDQGSPDWFKARAGIPTASEFSTVLAKGEGKTRKSYMYRLAGEIITGSPAETYSNHHMERGKVMEDEARAMYAFMEDVEPQRVGFITLDDKTAGASPDSLINPAGGLEVKTKLPALLIECIVRGELPPEHKAQVQGNIWISEREWWDFFAYWPNMPPFLIRVPRDDGYIANLIGEVRRFNDELAALVDRVRRYGEAA